MHWVLVVVYCTEDYFNDWQVSLPAYSADKKGSIFTYQMNMSPKYDA